MNEGYVTTESRCCGAKCISWSAVLLGALVAVGLSFLMNLFALSIGLSAFTTSPEGNTTLAVGGFVGLTIGTVVVMFVAGMTAACLGRSTCSKCGAGELYGFIAWCLALILTILLATNTAAFVTKAIDTVNPSNTTVSFNADNSKPVVAEQTPRQAEQSSAALTVNTEKAANTLGMATFITFFLFFVGALASCFGGRCGMTCRRNEGETKNKSCPL